MRTWEAITNERREKMTNNNGHEQPQGNALTIMANRYAVKPEQLKQTLKKTIIKNATDEQFITFCVVANQYRLNALTKEIYAFPDKREGIVPIVSTDGWNKLMTTHEKYLGHHYAESEVVVTPEGGKPCPEWMEIHIQKNDGGEVVVREHLNECYRPPIKRDNRTIDTPWQTHTRRMLRHKTKIQGAREAFGFGGIYDEDEGTRIVEAREAEGPEDIVGTVESGPVTTLTEQKHKKLMVYFSKCDMGGKDQKAHNARVEFIAKVLPVPIETTKELTDSEADLVIEALKEYETKHAKK
jgi:phage recombination protein Bet